MINDRTPGRRRRAAAGSTEFVVVVVVVAVSIFDPMLGSHGFSPPTSSLPHCHLHRHRRHIVGRTDVDRVLGAAGRHPKERTTKYDECVDVPSSMIEGDDDVEDDDGQRPAGDDVVASRDVGGGGTQGGLSASINLGKCICGAGSFALPYVFMKEGVLGGTIAMALCGYLSACTKGRRWRQEELF